MKIEKQLQDDHQMKLIVEFEQEKMDAYKHRAARKASERGKIPGFRPGKAPYEIIVRTFGDAAITEQAVDILVDEEYSNILKEADVNPGGSGTLESIDSLTPPKITFRVPLAPEADLGKNFLSLRMPYEWTAPDQKEVDAALDNLRQMYATTETVEREVGVGDYVLVDVASETPEMNRKGFAAYVREEDRDTEWPFNGFARELIGLKPNETKTIRHEFPKDGEVAELQDKSVELEATVKTVRGVTLPELNDEFAKMTGAGETLDALRAALAKDVEARSKADYDDKYFVDLIEKIKEGATFKYSQHALEHESEHVINDLQQRLSQQKLDLETYYKMRGTDKDKFFAEEVAPVAKKRLERSLIMDEIVRMEKIEVKKEELDAEFNDTLNALAQQGLDLAKVPGGKQGQKRLAESVAMESASRVLTRHALDMLKAVATGEYKPKEEIEEKSKDESAEVKEKPKAAKKTKKAEPASKSKKKAAAGSSTKKSPAKKPAAKK
ncbi:MAG: trigger factor [Anaerolineales bacterium]|nr:trigger factor [Anaerolineales bacterium]